MLSRNRHKELNLFENVWYLKHVFLVFWLKFKSKTDLINFSGRLNENSYTQSVLVIESQEKDFSLHLFSEKCVKNYARQRWDVFTANPVIFNKLKQ